jgi:hypothetical protein
MPVSDFQPITESGGLDVFELKRLGREVAAHDKLVGGSGLIVRRNGAGFQIDRQDPVVFWAKITGHGGGSPTPHSWTEQGEPSSGPPLADATDARTGTTTVFPAYALDGGITPNGHVVRLYLSSGGDYYLFDPGMSGATGSSLTVEQADEMVDVPNVTEIVLDQVTGLVIESSAANTVTLQNLPASATQQGVVNLVAQTLGAGDKRFTDSVLLKAGAPDTGQIGKVLFWDDGTHSTFSVGVPCVYQNVAELKYPAGSGATAWNTTITTEAGSPIGDCVLTFAAIPPSVATNGCGLVIAQATADPGNVYFQVTDSGGSFLGITGTELTLVNVRGGIVYGGSGMGMMFATDPSIYTYSGGL